MSHLPYLRNIAKGPFPPFRSTFPDGSEFMNGCFSAKLDVPSAGKVIWFMIVSNEFLIASEPNPSQKDTSPQMIVDLQGILHSSYPPSLCLCTLVLMIDLPSPPCYL